MTLHAMIDLETHGTGEKATIIQVGVVAFDPHGTGGELPEGSSQEWNVYPSSCDLFGGQEDAATMAWWEERPAATREAVYAEPRYTIEHVLDNLGAFWRRYEPARVWCHGATFDVPILQAYYRAAAKVCPWKFWDVRDTRTLFEMAEGLTPWRRPRIDTAHTARADAMAQAADVQGAMAALRGLKALDLSPAVL